MDRAVTKSDTVKPPLQPASSQPHQVHLLEAALWRRNQKSVAVMSGVRQNGHHCSHLFGKGGGGEINANDGGSSGKTATFVWIFWHLEGEQKKRSDREHSGKKQLTHHLPHLFAGIVLHALLSSNHSRGSDIHFRD